MSYYYDELLNWLGGIGHQSWVWINGMSRNEWLVAMAVAAGLGLLCMRGMNRQSTH